MDVIVRTDTERTNTHCPSNYTSVCVWLSVTWIMHTVNTNTNTFLPPYPTPSHPSAAPHTPPSASTKSIRNIARNFSCTVIRKSRLGVGGGGGGYSCPAGFQIFFGSYWIYKFSRKPADLWTQPSLSKAIKDLLTCNQYTDWWIQYILLTTEIWRSVLPTLAHDWTVLWEFLTYFKCLHHWDWFPYYVGSEISLRSVEIQHSVMYRRAIW